MEPTPGDFLDQRGPVQALRSSMETPLLPLGSSGHHQRPPRWLGRRIKIEEKELRPFVARRMAMSVVLSSPGDESCASEMSVLPSTQPVRVKSEAEDHVDHKHDHQRELACNAAIIRTANTAW